ncbi:MAG: DUF2283 domain-containing protein [Dehalococcoidia bacterium]|nr:DUF2283 domain-containing protein [Dehalococcoidia bacterium]
MRIEYDPELDILYIRLDAGQEHARNETFDVAPFFVAFDVDAEDRIAAIEILDASKRVNLAQLLPLVHPAAASA